MWSCRRALVDAPGMGRLFWRIVTSVATMTCMVVAYIVMVYVVKPMAGSSVCRCHCHPCRTGESRSARLGIRINAAIVVIRVWYRHIVMACMAMAYIVVTRMAIACMAIACMVMTCMAMAHIVAVGQTGHQN